MTDVILTGWNDLNENVKIGAAPARAIERGAHSDNGFLGGMSRGIALMTLRTRINRAWRYCWRGGLMNNLTNQLRRDCSRGRNRLVRRRRNLHSSCPRGGRQTVYQQFFYCVTRLVNKNLRFRWLVRGTQ